MGNCDALTSNGSVSDACSRFIYNDLLIPLPRLRDMAAENLHTQYEPWFIMYLSFSQISMFSVHAEVCDDHVVGVYLLC